MIMGAISGAFVGIAQGIVLRDRFSLWPVWIVANPLAWALGWLVSSYVISRNIDERFPIFGASGVAGVRDCITGLLLMAGTAASEVRGRDRGFSHLGCRVNVEVVAGAFLIVAPLWFNATFALSGSGSTTRTSSGDLPPRSSSDSAREARR